MRTVALDASAVIAWLFGEPGSKQIDDVLDRHDIHIALPGPVLTEVLAVARRGGNPAPPAEIAQTLMAHGFSFPAPTVDDLVRAAELLELGPRNERLSLADALVLAMVERLDWPVVTGDRAWGHLVEAGDVNASVVVLARSEPRPPQSDAGAQ